MTNNLFKRISFVFLSSLSLIMTVQANEPVNRPIVAGSIIFVCETADNVQMEVQLRGYHDDDEMLYTMAYLYGKEHHMSLQVEQSTEQIDYAVYFSENELFAQDFIMSDDRYYYLMQFYAKPEKSHNGINRVVIFDKDTGKQVNEHRCFAGTVSNMEITKVSGEQFNFVPMDDAKLMALLDGMESGENLALPAEIRINQSINSD